MPAERGPLSSLLRALGVLIVAVALPACGVGGGGTLSPTVAPQIPVNLVAKAGNHRVSLTWTGIANATNYTVKRSTLSGGPYTALPLGHVSTTSFIDAGLVNRVAYYYVVSASNAFGESPDSAEVPGSASFKALQVSSGSNSGSALLQDGTVWSWGLNTSGGLGNGLTTDSIVPVEVVGLPPVTQISIGGRTGLALDKDGRVWSWGSNDRLQLGRGTSIPSSPIPALVDTSTGLPPCAAVTSGWVHALVLGKDGTLWSWGYSGEGRLGSPGPNTSQPRQVVLAPGLSVVTAISTGDGHSLALSQDGTVWCWGANAGGQLGDPALLYANSVVPVQVFQLTGVVAIAGGGGHSIALRNDGSVWAWGSNYRSELGNGVGDGVTDNPLALVPLAAAPVLVDTSPTPTPLTGVIAIEAQGEANLALRSDGSIWAWGDSPGLGNPSVPAGHYSPFAIPVVGLAGQASVAAGGTCFSVGGDGTVWAWGNNNGGECAFGTAYRQTVAIQLPQLTSVTRIAAGGTPDPFQSVFGGQLVPGEGHGLSMTTTGRAWSWGNNNDNELAAGPLVPATFSATPRPVVGTLSAPLTGVTAIAGGGTHSVFVSGGGVWCAGTNSSGQLGSGNNTGSNVVVQTVQAGSVPLANALEVSAGEAHSLALLNEGSVWAWGLNSSGQLGNGLTSNSNVAVQVQTGPGIFLQNAVAVSAGFGHSVALLGDNSVWAWGDNQWGQVGKGSIGGISVYATPVLNANPAGPLGGIAEIAAGRFHTLARTSTGGVLAWGDNTLAQLGIDPAMTQVWPTPWILGALAPNHPFHTGFGEPVLREPAARPVVDSTGTPISGAVAISAGAYHSVALRDDLNDPTRLSLWTWGDGFSGALGNADATIESPAVPFTSFPFNSLITPFSPVPVPVQHTVPTGLGTLRGITSISAGAHFTLGRSSDGTVWGCGSNAQSQLGSDTIFLVRTPVPIDP